MERVPIHKRVIGLDIHQAQITACAIIEASGGETRIEPRQLGAFKRDRRELAVWASGACSGRSRHGSTGNCWKSPYAALGAVGIRATVVQCLPRQAGAGTHKTDVGDAQWLATLARAGLLRGSFVPLAQRRERRLIARQRQKLVGLLSSEKNRLHNVLTDACIRLGVVVSDIQGQSARAMIKGFSGGRLRRRLFNLPVDVSKPAARNGTMLRGAN